MKTDDILIGSLYELVLKNRTEEEQDLEFMRLAKEWGDKGYNLASGKVNEGKVDELWAVKFENNVEDKKI